MDDELLEQVKQLFQQSYKVIYQNGAFDVLSDQVEESDDPNQPIAQLVGDMINHVVADTDMDNIEVLYGLAILLIADLLDALGKEGQNIESANMEAIIGEVVQLVLAKNPIFVDVIKRNPAIEGMIKQMDQGQPQPQPQQGVMGQPEGVA